MDCKTADNGEHVVEYGKNSPVGVKWTDCVVALSNSSNGSEICLVHSIFNDPTRVYSFDEIQLLDKIDLRLDIPMIQARIHPSYEALNRMLLNECKNIPPELLWFLVMREADRGGALLSKFLYKDEYPWNLYTLSSSARSGNVPLLKY